MERLGIVRDDPREQMLDRALDKGVTQGTIHRPSKGVYTLPPSVTRDSLLKDAAAFAVMAGVLPS